MNFREPKRNTAKHTQTEEAIQGTLPVLCLVVLSGSVISAFFYSWYMTAPIKKVSKLSKKMADMDFSGFCSAGRTDEIGVLSDSLNTLSRKLSITLSELQEANQKLQEDIDMERQLERQRVEFFAAASHELYCEHMGEEFTLFVPMSKQSGLCDYLDEAGEPVYEFNCFVEFNAAYSINNPKLVSVAERDKVLLTYKEEMQNYLNGLSETEITDGDVKTMLIDKSAELADSLSIENMKLSPCEIYLLEINGEGAIQ